MVDCRVCEASASAGAQWRAELVVWDQPSSRSLLYPRRTHTMTSGRGIRTCHRAPPVPLLEPHALTSRHSSQNPHSSIRPVQAFREGAQSVRPPSSAPCVADQTISSTSLLPLRARLQCCANTMHVSQHRDLPLPSSTTRCSHMTRVTSGVRLGATDRSSRPLQSIH